MMGRAATYMIGEHSFLETWHRMHAYYLENGCDEAEAVEKADGLIRALTRLYDSTKATR